MLLSAWNESINVSQMTEQRLRRRSIGRRSTKSMSQKPDAMVMCIGLLAARPSGERKFFERVKAKAAEEGWLDEYDWTGWDSHVSRTEQSAK